MSRFTIEPTDVPGLMLIQAYPVLDDRGWFMRSFCMTDLAAAGVNSVTLRQENQSRSRQRVIRGLHTRSQLAEAKIVRVPRGRIFDVVVDLRPWSPTYLEWRSWILDDISHLQVRIPAGCAHGFQVLSSEADVCYLVDADYDPDFDVAILWNDPDIGITWPLADPILSRRDRAAPRLSAVRDSLSAWFGEPERD